MRCTQCGLETIVPIGADGQPADFDAAFTAGDLLRWFAAARVAMGRGQPGVALGACKRCRAPLVVSSRTPLSLPCPHCRAPVAGEAADVLVDQWPEPWARVEGGGLSLEYRVAIADDTTGVTAGCATCGAPTPSNDPSSVCARCGHATWAPRGGSGPRIQLGVRVDGTRAGRPFNQLVPMVQGESMLRSDTAIGASSESGKSMLGLTGIGCAIAIAFVVLCALAIGYCVHFSK